MAISRKHLNPYINSLLIQPFDQSFACPKCTCTGKIAQAEKASKINAPVYVPLYDLLLIDCVVCKHKFYMQPATSLQE